MLILSQPATSGKAEQGGLRRLVFPGRRAEYSGDRASGCEPFKPLQERAK